MTSKNNPVNLVLYFIISSIFLSCPLGGGSETVKPSGDENNNAVVTVPSFFWGSWVSGDDVWKVTDILVDRPHLADSAFKQADEDGFELWDVKVSKVSQNMLFVDGYEDFYLFRLSGADAEMTLNVKTVETGSGSVSRGISNQIAGLGNISVILQNIDISSDKHEGTTDSDGSITADGTISGATYQVTLEGEGISEPITTELSAFFDGQDVGTVMVNNPDKNLKLSYIIRGQNSWDNYIYALPEGAGEDYEIMLFFKNIGTEVITNLTYEVTPPPGLTMTGELTGTYPAITSSYSLILGVEADPIEDFRQSFIIPITMSDSEGNIWEDSIDLVFYRECVEISINSGSGDCRGVIITPEGQALPVSHPYSSFEIYIPARTEPYQLVISETDYYTGESWYSLGIDNDSTEIYSADLPESDPNEPNDSEYSTTPLFPGELVMGKIEAGDVDIFTTYVTPQNLHVLFEPEGGTYFSSLSVTLTNQAEGTLRWNDEGTTPEEGDSLYSGPIAMDKSGTIKASAFGGELPEGIVFTEIYELKVPAPSVTPGTEASRFLVEQNPSAPSGSALRNTLDGSEPDEYSSLCTTGDIITVDSGEILKVRAFNEGWTPSFRAASAYFVGERGPAGGYVIEDKGEYSDGWRYKEIRSEPLSEQHDWAAAAAICAELNDGGFSDWLLPSKFELRTFWEEIIDTDIDYYTGTCWSSTEVDRSGDAYQFTLYTGVSANMDVDSELKVLPIRYF